MSDSKSNIPALRQFLSVIAFFERKILGRSFQSEGVDFFIELAYVSKLYHALTDVDKETARNVIEKTNQFSQYWDRSIHTLGSYASLVGATDGERYSFAYPYHGGAVYLLRMKDGKSVRTTCVVGCEFLSTEPYHTGCLPIPTASTELDTKIHTKETVFLEADLKFKLTDVNKDVFYQVTAASEAVYPKSISPDSDEVDIHINGYLWLNVLALIFAGRDPSVELTNVERAKVLSLIFANHINTESLYQNVIRSYGAVSKDGHDLARTYVIDSGPSHPQGFFESYGVNESSILYFKNTELSDVNKKQLQEDLSKNASKEELRSIKGYFFAPKYTVRDDYHQYPQAVEIF